MKHSNYQYMLAWANQKVAPIALRLGLQGFFLWWVLAIWRIFVAVADYRRRITNISPIRSIIWIVLVVACVFLASKYPGVIDLATILAFVVGGLNLEFVQIYLGRKSSQGELYGFDELIAGLGTFIELASTAILIVGVVATIILESGR